MPLPLLSDFEQTLAAQLREALGPGIGVTVAPTAENAPPAIAVPAPFYEARELAAGAASARRYDVTVRLADGDRVVYRVTHVAGGAWLPRNLSRSDSTSFARWTKASPRSMRGQKLAANHLRGYDCFGRPANRAISCVRRGRCWSARRRRPRDSGMPSCANQSN